VLRHPAVADAAVVGVANRDGLIRLALFAVLADPLADHAATADDIRQSLIASLSIYKCPRRIVFVEEMPRTATGKIQRFMLRQMAADQLGMA
jgi:Acyl-CoA synthetases (AMP-forming)/AMP-acid ligases II